MFERQVIYNEAADVMEEHRLDRFGVSGSMTIEQKKKKNIACVLFFSLFLLMATKHETRVLAMSRDRDAHRHLISSFHAFHYVLGKRREGKRKKKKKKK